MFTQIILLFIGQLVGEENLKALIIYNNKLEKLMIFFMDGMKIY